MPEGCRGDGSCGKIMVIIITLSIRFFVLFCLKKLQYDITVFGISRNFEGRMQGYSEMGIAAVVTARTN
jgi:hypothetical protein